MGGVWVSFLWYLVCLEWVGCNFFGSFFIGLWYGRKETTLGDACKYDWPVFFGLVV